MQPRHSVLAAVLLLLLSCVASFPQDNSKNKQDKSKSKDADSKSEQAKSSQRKAPALNEKDFVKSVAMGNRAEIEMAKLAQQQGAIEDIKKYGARLEKDHSKAEDDLKKVADDQNISLPIGISAQQKSQKRALSRLSGAKFDRAYIAFMVEDHKKAVNEFQREAQYGHDPAIRKYASDTLPVLQDHLNSAKELEAKVGSSSDE